MSTINSKTGFVKEAFTQKMKAPDKLEAMSDAEFAEVALEAAE